ncbi:AIR synthase-related protein [Candidatus Saccharibacteria bacterium]|nr:AIR synthase-related protein [Candidatus Saccharibacteria bacterium]
MTIGEPQEGGGLRYEDAGVRYEDIDQLKVAAQEAMQKLAVENTNADNTQIILETIGESAVVVQLPDGQLIAKVTEGLGTKNIVADDNRQPNTTHYNKLAQDTVAMIVNDLITVGAMPQIITAYFGLGDSEWAKDEQRARELVAGWEQACREIGVLWVGGETPVLKGVIDPQRIDLAGDAMGIVRKPEHLVTYDGLSEGDSIVLIGSSGIHANGLSFVRKLAETNPDLYERKLSSGQTFGEAILTPTPLYVNLVRSLQDADVDLHYMANITGHGWRKLMRAPRDFSYVIDKIPEPQPEFALMQQLAGTPTEEMYSTFNMGAGFAIYVSPDQVDAVIAQAEKNGLSALVAGHVEAGERKVVIRPLNLVYAGETLQIR